MPLPFSTWKAAGASPHIRGVHATCKHRFLNHANNTGGRGLEAELFQLEQPHRATVVSTQDDCSMVKTAFAQPFVIAMSRCFSCRNSRPVRRSSCFQLVWSLITGLSERGHPTPHTYHPVG